MGVEPFDLDAGTVPSEQDREPAPPGPGRDHPEGDPGNGLPGRAHPGPGHLARRVAALVLVAAVAATATGLHVRARVEAAQREHQRSQVRLVATSSGLVAARATGSADGARTSDVVLSVQLVNAGPTAVRLLALRADGTASGLDDALGSGRELPAAQVTRVLLFGGVACGRGDHQRAGRARVRVLDAAGGTRWVGLGDEVAASWTSALQRSCALPVATP